MRIMLRADCQLSDLPSLTRMIDSVRDDFAHWKVTEGPYGLRCQIGGNITRVIPYSAIVFYELDSNSNVAKVDGQKPKR